MVPVDSHTTYKILAVVGKTFALVHMRLVATDTLSKSDWFLSPVEP